MFRIKKSLLERSKIVKTETTIRFEEELKIFGDKLQEATLQYKDGIKMYELCQNIFLRYEQIRDSRETWKQKYFELKGSLKKDPRTITSMDPNYKKG